MLLPVRKHGCLLQVNQDRLERDPEPETVLKGRVLPVRQSPGPKVCDKGSRLRGVQQAEGTLTQGGSGLEAGRQTLPSPGRGSRSLEGSGDPQWEPGLGLGN